MLETAPALSDALRARLHQQLATMERAGIPVIQAMGMLELPGTEQARVHGAVQRLKSGRPLAEAARDSGLFTPIEALVIAAATDGGSPALAHERLAERANTRAEQFKRIRTRLLLPVFLLIAAMVILPLPALVGGSLSLTWYVLRIVLVIGLLAAASDFARRLWLREAAGATWAGRAQAEQLALQAPVLGPLLVRVQVQRFFENLALLLEAGLPAVDAVRSAASTVGIESIRNEFERMLPQLAAGGSFGLAIREVSVPCSVEVQGMIAAGEGSGRLPELMDRFARAEARRIASSIDTLVTWLPRLVYLMLVLWLAGSVLSAFIAIITRRID